MEIALIGYGKMGKEIEEIAVQRGHKIGLRISSSNIQDFTQNNFSVIDTAIEFTTPSAAFGNVKKCLDYRVPVVSGSTGWNDKVEELKNYCLDKNGCFLYASNFSIGVQILFAMNRYLAQLMAPQPDYEVSIHEIHHTQKKDAPSGTAVSLAEQIISVNPHKNKWVNDSLSGSNEIPIFSKRIDPAPGTHVIKYASPIDDIELIHTAHSRKGFALGAVLAAEFISGKKGVFSMSDVLGFDNL